MRLPEGYTCAIGLKLRLWPANGEISMINRRFNRREFLKTAAVLGAAAATPSALSARRHSGQSVSGRFEPEFTSLDKRTNPAWFDDDKIGIFLHWSVFSVPAIAWVYPGKPYGYGGHSCWYGLYIDHIATLAPSEQAKLEAFHRKNYGDIPFRAMGPLFKAEVFDPEQWADLFKRSGARYSFMTSNFHDGYCLWPSPYSPGWNSGDVGPKRDLLGDFSSAMRQAGLRAGFYYSLGEFNHPLYQMAKQPQGDLKRFVREHMQPQLREAVNRYSPSLIYFDGEWEFPLDSFEMQNFLAWLYNDSPCKEDVVVNDRFGAGSRGKHGGVFCSEAGVRESGVKFKWCEDRPISRGNWSYNRLERLEDYLSERDLIHLLVETVALGGNLHVDISPCADGTIPMLQQERLVQMGDWLKVNGEAIYQTRRWIAPTEGPMVESLNPRLDENWIWTDTKQRPLVQYTRKGDLLYAICLAWPGKTLKLSLPGATPQTRVEMLGHNQPLTWRPAETGLVIDLPPFAAEELPCRNAWAFKLSGVGTTGWS
jgi:alpha-L-fucosidase